MKERIAQQSARHVHGTQQAEGPNTTGGSQASGTPRPSIASSQAIRSAIAMGVEFKVSVKGASKGLGWVMWTRGLHQGLSPPRPKEFGPPALANGTPEKDARAWRLSSHTECHLGPGPSCAKGRTG